VPEIEFAHGRDVATHIDEAIRSASASSAVVSMIIAKETPW
jgi:hypothetical protein